ncbi:MAG: restriction endonuclease subunit S [Staphylococcus equorum]|uniref:Type I restriction modification DNA specificity domain-containing protein n=1 Tax=Tetragenococcus koreensis TaxID=290335 RepID=A0AAN4RLW9_9ENTE|nr:restriction endonuclease subunit S [Tetragenococcus koreensis]MDN6698846.1 restriction endonuclease subunit S [Staphylococcus equorum]GEN90053.1 hypothetical protein TKO01_00990 [Tetragenococcus koreensis]GEQ49385.1 hypothetical protein TK11N_12370 [Tetragenococcus koreensis]GEQ51918.1 hypothetical protein TK12N_12620 [Tetragenococcus koreensis]GEQ54453.1 hypothetical protein TK2N_12970 [Tetragenococcus koreensis]
MSRSKLNYDEVENKSIHYGDLLDNYGSILDVRKDWIPFITNGTIHRYKSQLFENVDMILVDTAENETIGKAVEVNGINNKYIVAGLYTIVARPIKKKVKYFMGNHINSHIYHKQLLHLMYGTKVSSISKSNFQRTIVSYPKNFNEQRKIGLFFKQIDNAITLHQHRFLIKIKKR